MHQTFELHLDKVWLDKSSSRTAAGGASAPPAHASGVATVPPPGLPTAREGGHAVIHSAAPGRHAADDAVPQLRRLLLRQSRPQPAASSPSSRRRCAPPTRISRTGCSATAIATTSSSATAAGSASRRSSRPSTRRPASRCRASASATSRRRPRFSGVLQGDFGCSTAFRTTVAKRLPEALKATGILMFWVMIVMVPVALSVGVLAGMREGSRLDRTPVGGVDRLDRHARICVGRHLLRDLCLMARLAQRLGRHCGDARHQLLAISRCR